MYLKRKGLLTRFKGHIMLTQQNGIQNTRYDNSGKET